MIFLVIANILFFQVEKRLYSETAKEYLVEQAEVVAGHIPSLAENDYYSRAGFIQMQIAKLKALDLALEPYDDIEQAKPLLDAFSQVAGVEALVVYDRNCAPIYTSREDLDVTVEEGDKAPYIRALEEDSLNDYAECLPIPTITRTCFLSRIPRKTQTISSPGV